MKKKLGFDEWFRAQFGKRRKDFLKKTDEDLVSLIYMGRKAEAELDRRNQYDVKERTALSAYCAFSPRKGKKNA